MPQPPKPNAMRAVIGFLLGMVIMVIIIGFLRKVMYGLGFYAVPVEIFNGVFAGWFWEDEATLMFAMLGGAMGFIWGSGALYDFSKEDTRAPRKRTRIPTDPDAPRDLTSSPIAPLLDALPSVFIIVPVLIGVVILLRVIPLSGQTVTQTTNEAADFAEFGSSDFNFLGIIKIENANQTVLFFIFAAVVVGAIMITGIGIALAFFLLNRQVTVAHAEEARPTDGATFLPTRIMAFFTDWAVDVLDGVSSIVRPR